MGKSCATTPLQNFKNKKGFEYKSTDVNLSAPANNLIARSAPQSSSSIEKEEEQPDKQKKVVIDDKTSVGRSSFKPISMKNRQSKIIRDVSMFFDDDIVINDNDDEEEIKIQQQPK